MIAVTGCDKKSGYAMVLSKEHIAAAPPTEETPSMSPSNVPRRAAAGPAGTQTESDPGPNVEIRPMSDDEIDVDGHVMKPELRGTSRDPRALKDEQWLVKVRMLDNGRTFQVPADQSQWQRLRENDKVKVRYRIGKYTGTVWAAELE
jgi:hypothetical protein